MSSLVLSLLQQQRISIFVIVAAVLALAIGLALVIYFYRRFKETEKQATQEDWQAGMHALFVDRPTASGGAGAREIELSADDFDLPGKAVPRKRPELVEPQIKPAAPNLTAASGTEFDDFDQPGKAVPRQRPALEPTPDAPPLVSASESAGHSKPERPSGTELLGTQILASVPAQPQPRPESLPEKPSEKPGETFAEAPPEPRVTPPAVPKQPPPIERPVFQQQPVPAPPQAPEITLSSPDPGQTQTLASSDLSAEVRAPRATSLFGTTDSSRGAGKPSRESYEPPAITPIKRREAYEPPMIQPLEPREEIPSANAIKSGSIRPTRVEVPQQPPVLSSKQVDRQVVPTGVVNRLDDIVPATASGTGHDRVPASSIPATASRTAQDRVPAGSILGLPAAASKAPMRYGTPARPDAETGIDSLVHYGRPADSGGGRAGSVVLVALLVLMVAAGAVYFFVPSVNTRVKNWLTEVRSVSPEGVLPAPVDPPHANIFPSRRPEVTKNIVKARGAVDNTTTPPQTLENLSLEIILGRGEGNPTETLRIPINPSSLAPGQRGIYEFEYDRSMGFREYRIVKLWSGDTELRFSSPAPDQGVGSTAAAPPRQ